MAKIKSPNKDYTGISAGVSFVKGEAETDDPWLIEWFESKGYKIEGVKQSKPKKKAAKKEGD